MSRNGWQTTWAMKVTRDGYELTVNQQTKSHWSWRVMRAERLLRVGSAPSEKFAKLFATRALVKLRAWRGK